MALAAFEKLVGGMVPFSEICIHTGTQKVHISLGGSHTRRAPGTYGPSPVCCSDSAGMQHTSFSASLPTTCQPKIGVYC